MKSKFFLGDLVRVRDNCGPCKSMDGAYGQIVEFDSPWAKVKIKDVCLWLHNDALQNALREYIAIN